MYTFTKCTPYSAKILILCFEHALENLTWKSLSNCEKKIQIAQIAKSKSSDKGCIWVVLNVHNFLALKTLNTFKEPIGSLLKAFLLSTYFLAASVSFRSHVVCPSAGWLGIVLCEQLPLEYQIVNKTFLRPTYLPNYVKVETVVTVVTVITVLTVVTVVTKQLFFTPKKLFSPKNYFDQNTFFFTKQNFSFNKTIFH